MQIIAGLFYFAVGVVFLLFSKPVARRQGVGTAVCAVLWGVWACTFGILDFAEGFGHPLLSSKVRFVVFIAFTLLCLSSLFLIRRPKKP